MTRALPFRVSAGRGRLLRLAMAGGCLALGIWPHLAGAQPAPGEAAASPPPAASEAVAPAVKPPVAAATVATEAPAAEPASVAAPAVVEQPLGKLPPGANPAIAEAIGRQFTAVEASVAVGGRAYPIEPLRTFYRSRGNAALWVDADGLNARGTALIAGLDNARLEGLDSALYRVVLPTAGGASADALAGTDIALSMALVRYAGDLSIGRGAASRSDPNLRMTAKTIDPAALLLGAADAGDIGGYLAALGPQDPIYRGLRRALARYRTIEEQSLWSPLPAGLTLQAGSTGPQVRMLRQVLAATGDFVGDPGDLVVYDDALTEAVKRFQRRHRVAQTGTINADTRQAFNVPPAMRVRQVLVNLERRRWMPDDLGEAYIFVNLPDFTLNVIDGGQSALKMNVVIGKPTWPTPIFSDMIEYLEVNPHWNVPPMILKKEVLPKMRSNPGYAAASGLRVFYNGRPVDPYSVNWSATGGAGYSFRQDPGQRNALGRIKFMLPNEFAVYLHDTPSKSLFSRSVRAFSHGCVRVERPLDLAEYLLTRDGGDWNRGRIEKVIKTGKNRAIELKTPMPVHLTYFTALPDSDGIVQFSNDIYGRDTTLGRTLFASAD